MEQWVVEYSTSQGCCHIDTLGDAIAKNLQAIEEREHPDFVPVGIFSSADTAGEFASAYQKLRTERTEHILSSEGMYGR